MVTLQDMGRFAWLRRPAVPVCDASEAVETVDKLGGGGRAADEVTLRGVAAEGGNEVEGVLGFHSFRHDPQAQRVGELNRRPHDRQGLGVPGNAGEEAAVQLELIDRHLAQVGQRCETGALVIHRDTAPELLEAAKHFNRAPRVGHDVIRQRHGTRLRGFPP